MTNTVTSSVSWKTSNGHDNFHIRDKCYQNNLVIGERLVQILCVFYLVLFENNIEKAKIIVLIDFERKINIINLTYITKLYLWVQKIDFIAQKIDSSSLKTWSIVIAVF